MKHHLVSTLVLGTLLAGASVVLAQHGGSSSTPPGHPAIMPEGHPQTQPGAPDRPVGPPPAADPVDVESPEAIVAAYYDALSAGPGEERNWDRFRSLFLPTAQFTTAREAGEIWAPVQMTADDYVMLNDRYFRAGYFESQIRGKIDRFGHIAQVFSSYASRRRADGAPYSRGINSFQLYFDGTRWWIASLMWDYERPDTDPLPAEWAEPAGS